MFMRRQRVIIVIPAEGEKIEMSFFNIIRRFSKSGKRTKIPHSLLRIPCAQFPIITAVFISLIFTLLFSGAMQAQNTLIDFKVQYISAEHVYLDGGKDKGLAIGDTLIVRRLKTVIAEVVVEFVSEHSASCRVIQARQNPVAGDLAALKSKTAPAVEEKKPLAKHPLLKEKENEKASPERNHIRISGSMGFQWYQFIDNSAFNLNFSQPTVRLNFKARNIWNRPFNLFIKLRSRYNKRERAYNSDVPQKEWRNRIYELYFSYEDEKAPLNFRFGRIISNTLSGVGYIDGVLLQHNLTNKVRWGIFAGTQPEWQYSDFQTSLQKYGLYANYLRGDYTSSRLEATLAAAGEYHGSTVSREFIYMQTSYYHGKRWNIYQSTELDVNRGWRKEKSGQTISLSGLYVSGNYYFADWISAGLSYDNRKNYYTYEMRGLADSLFDAAFRHGLRATLNGRILKNTRFSINFGLRERETGAQYTYSYGTNLTQNNLFLRGLMLSVRFNGFHNLYTTGYNPSLQAGKNFSGGHSVSISYGNYFYRIDRTNSDRLNQWLRAAAQIELPLRLYLSGQYEYDWGDDRRGHLILAEVGYRF